MFANIADKELLETGLHVLRHLYIFWHIISLQKFAHAINRYYFSIIVENNCFIGKCFDNFSMFQQLAQNIDCGCTLEPPRRGRSNEYPQSMFWSKNKKNRFTPANLSFAIQGRIQADAWKPGLQCDFFKYGISLGLSEKKI